MQPPGLLPDLQQLPPDYSVIVRRIASVAACSQSGLISGSPQTKGAADRSAAPFSLGRMAYFRLVIAVRSAESLTIPVAPHQLEPKPPGLIAVTKLVLKLVVVWSLVNALQLALERLVSE
jgi:hypothetical protein